MTRRLCAISAATCLALAAGSLAIAHEPVYDGWAWLVWGRELAGLDLDTTLGPAFKPLPVLVTAPLSLAGDAAPALWLLLVRASWLVTLVLAGAIAQRLTLDLDRRLRVVAVAFAVFALALLSDDVTAWARQGAAGMSEPVLVVLVLGAVAAQLHGRSSLALVLAGLAALVRPETWPLLAAYGVWRWRAEPALRPWIAAVAVAVPALWFGPGVLGGAATSATRALRGTGTPLAGAGRALGGAATMPLIVAWPFALFAVLDARARGAAAGRAVVVLAAGALAAIATVAVMAAGGFAGLQRFMAPAAAIVCVLAGVGLARLLARRDGPGGGPLPGAPEPGGPTGGLSAPGGLTRAPFGRGLRSPALAAGAAVAVLVTAAELPERAAELPHALARNAQTTREHDRLRALVSTLGSDALLRCGRLATSDVLVRTALAWELAVPLSQVVSFGEPPVNSGAFVVGLQASPSLRAYMASHAELLGARGEWRVYSIDCPPAAAATSGSGAARSAGVSGAQR
jgi:hypothetical protein